MALAVTHVLGAIIILDLLRHYVFGKNKFPRYLIVIGGIAGLAPDIDIVLSWFMTFITGTEVSLHGVFTHSFFWVFFFLTFGLMFQYKKEMKWAKIFYVIAAGWTIHLSLDCAFNSYETFLWPLPWNTAKYCPQGAGHTARVSVDAILLVLWLVHEEIHNKIKDYI